MTKPAVKTAGKAMVTCTVCKMEWVNTRGNSEWVMDDAMKHANRRHPEAEATEIIVLK